MVHAKPASPGDRRSIRRVALSVVVFIVIAVPAVLVVRAVIVASGTTAEPAEESTKTGETQPEPRAPLTMQGSSAGEEPHAAGGRPSAPDSDTPRDSAPASSTNDGSEGETVAPMIRVTSYDSLSDVSLLVADTVKGLLESAGTDTGERSGRYGRSGVLPSLPSGNPVTIPGDEEALGAFVRPMIAGETPPITSVEVDARYLETVLDAFGEEADPVDLVYRVSGNDEPAVIVLRDTSGDWWTMWLYFKDGLVFDLEYRSGVPEI
ncbi:MAG: hypothetical protein ACLFR8_08875 [Alkalispirochaeta sp.]